MIAPQLILSESFRKKTFQKRKKSIYKKADELSKLCGIDVCLIVCEDDPNKGRSIQPEMWPPDPIEFNRILDKYKSSEDVPAPGSRRNLNLSNVYEVKSEDVLIDANELQSLSEQISEEKLPTWDDRINVFSHEELIELLGLLEAKIQISTKKIDSMERYKRFAAKQNQNSCRAEPSTSKAPRDMNSKPTHYDVQKPYQVTAHQT